ncbi:hypothetical protein [Paraburkholderia guartelaensis]|uniref:Uncharacterized protein n=1 Tax=Paraburkholderia guartelaensis TaxID=2546446 RepID=A0ABU9S9S8_9BURK
MALTKDVQRLTGLHRYWGSRKTRIFNIFAQFAFSLLSSVSFAQASREEVAACPVVAPSMGIFSGDTVYKNSIIAIEDDKERHQIDLSLYVPLGDKCKKTSFAKYSLEGGDPNVDSLFFIALNGEANVFAIVHWDVNSRGAGTFGKYYQIYAYAPDHHGGLMENETVVNSNEMTGMDGYQDGVQMSFAYKNAGAIRNFYKCGAAFCK